MINKERARDIFLDLARINSPSKHERGVADYLIAKLDSMGFEVKEDDAGERTGGDTGNVIARLKGNSTGGKRIFLGGHMDTVEPTDKLNIVIDGDEITSDGTTILGADDKAGIASIIEGVQSVIEDDKPHADIDIIFNVSEEIGLLGARSMNHAEIDVDYGFVFDTQKPVCCITWTAPSHVNIFVEITGKASHAGMAPEMGVSAILAASNAISKMNLGRIDSETTANVGVIQGGKARNIVPDKVTIKAEARSRDESKLAAQVQHMKTVFEQEAAKVGAKADVKAENEYSAFKFTESDPIVKLAVAASERIGLDPVFMDGGGGSDANVFNKAGIPVLNIGVGYDGAHSTSERVSVSDIAKCAQYVSALIETASEC